MRQLKKVEGVGTNDADYAVVKDKCQYYAIWQAMLRRCYSAKSLARNPNYVGCSVHPDWFTFSTFKAWMMDQDWVGKSLDKDLRVPGNKIYSPDTCLFISQGVNTLLNTQPNQGGNLPLGVVRCKDKYKVTLKKQKKTVHIGVYPTVEEAAQAYRAAKADWIEQHAAVESCPIARESLMRVVANFRRP